MTSPTPPYTDPMAPGRRQPGVARAPEVAPVTEQDKTFDRIPDLHELIEQGGRAGLVYCLVWGANERKFEREWFVTAYDPSLNKVRAYHGERVRDVPTLTLHGPKGTCDAVILMCAGNVIPGAAPGNGKRRYLIDLSITEQTGLGDDPAEHIGEVRVSLAEVEAAKTANLPNPNGGRPRKSAPSPALDALADEQGEQEAPSHA